MELIIAKTYKDKGVGATTHCNLNEQDLIDAGMKQHLMVGTGWLTTSSMKDAIFWYEKGRIAINATEIAWTWFLDNQTRNDISVSNKKELKELLKTYKNKTNDK